MPLGSRIVAVSALALLGSLGSFGCSSATKQPALPLRASIAPAADAKPAGRTDPSPVVKNADFQTKTTLPTNPSVPQPNVTPAVTVPTIPTTGFPPPAMTEPVPPAAPGLAGTPQPPIAETGGTGGLVMPSLFEKK